MCSNQLVYVDYNGGLSNEVVEWDYDAAGNRKSDSRYSSGGTWTYDWLNRMTQSPSLDGTGPSTWNYTNDILGNRTERNITTNNAGAAKYVWDPLNRMEILFRPSVGASYYYRADGMRVEKVDGATLSWFQISRDSGQYDTNYAQNRATTRYFYDGQMPIEEDYNPSGTVTKVTRNTLGGRGIDMISTTTSTGTEDRYPLYDGHGNMIATLGKDGSGGCTIDDLRTYDVWGSVRSGAATGDLTKRYLANIGHLADDESDLIYMRARYYEPRSGRFASEDQGRQGANWYPYCGSDPINNLDFSGKYFNPFDFLEEANRIFASRTHCGFGTYKPWIEQLEKIQEYLRDIVRTHSAAGKAQMAASRVTAEAKSWFGEIGVRAGIQISAAQRAAGARFLTDATVARIGIQCIDIMIEYLRHGDH